MGIARNRDQERILGHECGLVGPGDPAPSASMLFESVQRLGAVGHPELGRRPLGRGLRLFARERVVHRWGRFPPWARHSGNLRPPEIQYRGGGTSSREATKSALHDVAHAGSPGDRDPYLPRRADDDRRLEAGNVKAGPVTSDSRDGHPDYRAMQSKWPKNGPAIDASPRVGRCPSVAGSPDQGPRHWMKVARPRSRIPERWPAWHHLHLRPGGGGGGLRLTATFLTISA
jgi:hypothetical protein